MGGTQQLAHGVWKPKSCLIPAPLNSGPGGLGSSPPDPWKPSFFFWRADDFSHGLAGRVGDQLGHP